MLDTCICASLLQLCLIFCDPMDHSPPGSSVHGILQARTVEWVACPPSGDLLDPGMKPVSLTFPALAVGFFTTSATWEALCAWYLSHITNVITPTHTSAVPCTSAHPFLSLVIHIYTIYICFQLQIITERSRTKIAARPVWFYNSHLLSAAGPSRRVGKDFPRAQTGRFLRASISMPLNCLSTTVAFTWGHMQGWNHQFFFLSPPLSECPVNDLKQIKTHLLSIPSLQWYIILKHETFGVPNSRQYKLPSL